jgi:hypothetical protein
MVKQPRHDRLSPPDGTDAAVVDPERRPESSSRPVCTIGRPRPRMLTSQLPSHAATGTEVDSQLVSMGYPFRSGVAVRARAARMARVRETETQAVGPPMAAERVR